MKRVLLLDESPLFSAQLTDALGSEADVVGPVEGEVFDAVVVNPSWQNWDGLRFLLGLCRRSEPATAPLYAVLDGPNPAVEFLLSELAIPFGLKDPATAQAVHRSFAIGGPQGSIPEEWTLGWEELPDARTLDSLFQFAAETARLGESLPGSTASTNEVLPFVQTLERLERELHEVDQIHRVFSRFLPPEVIGSLMRKKTTTALLTGEKRRIVALFSHIRDFSFYLEHNEPAKIVEFLNRHFQLYSDVIRRHGGYINKYIGDAVFALFGAPVSYLDNADRALNAAVEISDALRHLEHPGIVLPPGGYRVGIGLNEGLAIVGNIGSTDSFDYTAIGDAINLAARLESLNKHYQTEILLSEGFREALTPQADRVLRIVDRAKVKGKKEATTFYTVIGNTGPSRAFLDAYEKGLKMIKIGNWLTAGEWLDRAQALQPDDSLVQIHLTRVQKYTQNPPSDWDGAEELSFK